MSSCEADTAPMKAILISGAPGAGKTTVTRLLAERLPRAVAIEADVLSFDFVRSPPVHQRAGEWDRLRELRARQVCLLADSYAEAGFVPVIDEVVNRTVFDLYRKYLRLRPLLFVALVPEAAVGLARDAGRERHMSELGLTIEILTRMDEELRSTMDGVGLHLDTSALTAGETVDHILSHLPEAIALT